MYVLEHNGRWFSGDNCLSEKNNIIKYTKPERLFSIYTKYIRHIFFSLLLSYYQGFYKMPGKCDHIHLNVNHLAKIYMKTDLV